MPKLSNRITRTILFKRDGNKCAYCNVTLSHKTATIDHIIPVSLWGSRGSFLNMVLSCGQCNQEKADRLLLDYLRSRQVVYLRNNRIRKGLKYQVVLLVKKKKIRVKKSYD